MAAVGPKAAAVSPPAPVPEALGDARLRLQAAIGAASIAAMAVAELEAVEITGGVRFGDAVVVLPADWFPAGGNRRLSKRSFSLETMATDRHPTGGPGHAMARLSVLRALVAFWVLPLHVGPGHGTLVLKPTTYILRAKTLLYLTRQVLAVGDPSHVSGQVFGGLAEARIQRVVEAARRAYSSAVPSLIASMDQLRARGVIHDWFPPPRPAAGGAGDGPPAPERARRGVAPPTSDPDDDRAWQPLPDAFVGEQGWRALWLIERLGPSLIGCLARLAAEGLLGSVQKHAALKPRQVEAARRAIIAGHRWQGPDGVTIGRLPFPLRFGRSERLTDWPPPGFGALQKCTTVLQTCHVFATLMSMGARWSEVASLRRDCLRPDDAGGGRVEGRSYKLIDGHGGAVRDWPLHPTAVAAIEQQVRLAEVLAPHTDHLWVARSGKGLGGGAEGELYSVDEGLPRLARVTGTEALLGGSRFHSHRFRKTIARLAALALVGAPKILMDLFGHRTVEMTLRYVLSDPALAVEVQEVARATAVMLGEGAVETAGDNGGPAGESLRAYLASRTAAPGAEVLGTDSLQEAAEILTAHGKAVAVVRPGILCTKLPGQAGPCTQKVGHPDPSRCKVGCDHRLDLAAAKQDAVRVIERAVEALRAARAEGDEMQRAFWEGQIKAHVRRFEDLAARFADRPEIASALDGTGGAVA